MHTFHEMSKTYKKCIRKSFKHVLDILRDTLKMPLAAVWNIADYVSHVPLQTIYLKYFESAEKHVSGRPKAYTKKVGKK